MMGSCRGDPIDLVEMDAGRQRMLTASGHLVKVWAVKGHRVLKELRWVSQPCALPSMSTAYALCWRMNAAAAALHAVLCSCGM